MATETPRLPRSGLELRDGVLTQAFQDRVLVRHDLRQAEKLRFEKGLHRASLKLAVAPLAAAILSQVFLPSTWWSWVLTGVFLLVALPIVKGAWGESLCFETEGRTVRLALVGTPQEISEFHAAMSAAVRMPEHRPPDG